MSISNKTRIFEVDGIKYRFDSIKFKSIFNDYCKNRGRDGERKKKCDVEVELADSLNVTSSAVHNWLFQKNGPSSYEIIKGIASFFEADIKIFLEEVIEDKTDKNIFLEEVIEDKTYMQMEAEKEMLHQKQGEVLNNKQIDSLKRIYDKILDYLGEFKKTCGFATLIYNHDKMINAKTRRILVLEELDKKIEDLNVNLYKEGFYLRDTTIYEELFNFINNDLIELYDGKLADRIPGGNVDGEFYLSLKKLENLTAKYVYESNNQSNVI